MLGIFRDKPFCGFLARTWLMKVSLYLKTLVFRSHFLLWAWMFRYVLGDPSGNYFVQCVAAHPAAVHTTYRNHDGELVTQPRPTETGFTEQRRGNQPLSLLPGHP